MIKRYDAIFVHPGAAALAQYSAPGMRVDDLGDGRVCVWAPMTARQHRRTTRQGVNQKWPDDWRLIGSGADYLAEFG